MDSDEENDRQKNTRDKQTRERVDYDMNRNDSSTDYQYQHNNSSSHHNNSNNKRPYQREYYSPNKSSHYQHQQNRYSEAPQKRQRFDGSADNRGGGGGSYYHGGGGGPRQHQPRHHQNENFSLPTEHLDNNTAGGGGDCQRTQPPMISFKCFIEREHDEITMEEATKMYNEYKEKFQRDQLLLFFKEHSDEEWFQDKYAPARVQALLAERQAKIKRRLQIFMRMSSSAKWKNAPPLRLDSDCVERIISVMDSMTALLESGEEVNSLFEDEEGGDKTDKTTAAKSGDADETLNFEIDNQEDGNVTTSEEKEQDRLNAANDDDATNPVDAETTKGNNETDKERNDLTTNEKKLAEDANKDDDEDDDDDDDDDDSSNSGDSDDSNSGDSDSSDSNSDDENEGEKSKGDAKHEVNTKAGKKSANKSTSKATTGGVASGNTSKQAHDVKGLTSSLSATSNTSHESSKTCSIFLKNIPIKVTREYLVSVCQKHRGFLRLCLQDPQIGGAKIGGTGNQLGSGAAGDADSATEDGQFTRRAWVTYNKSVNIKEICWSLNNLPEPLLHMGALVNRDISQRVRLVSPIANHRAVMKRDVQNLAKLVQRLDELWALWSETNKNPLLENIMDYLVEDGDFEEELLTGKATRKRVGNDSKAGDNEAGNDGGDSEDTNKTQEEEEEETAKTTPNWIESERDEALSELVDRLVLYLRLVYSIDYYSAAIYPDENSMPHLCAVFHVRNSPKTADPDCLSLASPTRGGGDNFSPLKSVAGRAAMLHKKLVNEYINEFNEKLGDAGLLIEGLPSITMDVTASTTDETESKEAELPLPAPSFPYLLSGQLRNLEPDLVRKFGYRDPDEVCEEFIKKNTVELEPDKFSCPLSGKKFKGVEFVRKHILNKHVDKYNEVREQTEFLNNYLQDVKKPQLPANTTTVSGGSGGGGRNYQHAQQYGGGGGRRGSYNNTGGNNNNNEYGGGGGGGGNNRFDHNSYRNASNSYYHNNSGGGCNDYYRNRQSTGGGGGNFNRQNMMNNRSSGGDEEGNDSFGGGNYRQQRGNNNNNNSFDDDYRNGNNRRMGGGGPNRSFEMRGPTYSRRENFANNNNFRGGSGGGGNPRFGNMRGGGGMANRKLNSYADLDAPSNE